MASDGQWGLTMNVFNTGLVLTFAIFTLAACTTCHDDIFANRDSYGPPPAACSAFLGNDPTGIDGTTPDGRAAIEKCADAVRMRIDMRWADFERRVNASLSTSNTLIDASIAGLGTSISLVASGTRNVLSAISSGLNGTPNRFDRELLRTYKLQLILQQMRIDRAIAGTRIEARLAGNTANPYKSMAEATVDLLDYQQAGSFDHALMSLQTTVAARAAACESRLREQKAMGMGAQAPASAAALSCDAIDGAQGVTAVDIVSGAVFATKDGRIVRIQDRDRTGKLHYVTLLASGSWDSANPSADTAAALLAKLEKLVVPGG